MSLKSRKVMRRLSSNDRKYLWALFGYLLVTCLIFLWLAHPAAAQDLLYSVPEMRLQVFVQPDASGQFIYDITFANETSGSPIDIIDIGTPNDNYDISNMHASLDGLDITDIRVSEVIDTGVEIHLRDSAIQPGQVGKLHFEFTMPDMVFQDTTRNDYASLEVSPTWFGPENVIGDTDLQIAIHLLPEVTLDEVLYQDVPFTNKIVFEEHSVVGWRWQDGDVTGSNLVGVSFPKRGMTYVIEQSRLDLTREWLKDNSGIRWALVGLSYLFLIAAFFRFTGGTGISVFVLLAIGLFVLLAANILSVLLVLPFTATLFGLNEWAISKRKMQYLPAIAQVEGGGIKRGLTAPEAAILLELPLNKVLLLIFFGLLEKGVIQLQKDKPLTIEISPEYRAVELTRKQRKSHRQKVSQKLGVILRNYEHPFLDQLEEQKRKPVQDIDFSKPMEKLIRQTALRVKGFDLSDTQDYYKKIIAKAMNQAKGIGDIQEKERYLDRHLQWLLLDDDFPSVFTTQGYQYRPVWIRPFASSDRIGGPTVSSKTSTSSFSGRTSFADVAASFVGWTENTMGNLANSISPDFLQVKGPSGVVNLSGVDRVTGDVFKALASSSGGGGTSSGGGCACACAGCACACACAGGGR